jgi:hypothetical protein
METVLDASRPVRLSNWDRVAAGAVILIAALGLILLGGCFMIGAVILVTNNFSSEAHPTLSVDEQSLLIALYVLASICFLGALVLTVVALRGLGRLLMEKRTVA